MKKPVFKQSHQHQMMLFPPSLDSMIDEHHPCRVVDSIIEKIDISELLATYKGGGCSAYHPKALLKVLVYAYLKNVFSSRNIEEALKENIHFMWLSGMITPDHSTINDFRSKKLSGLFEDIFTQVVLLLAEEGLVDLKDIYTDGTKLEASANRYTFVWGKSISTQKEKIKEKLASFWAYVEELYKAEAKELVAPDFKEISAENVEKTIAKINEALAGKKVDEEIKKKLKYAEQTYPDKLREYAEKERILGQRNSYSKTDKDATFMRMKEDHMRNGQLKPAYNIQFSTSNQYVVHYSLGQTTADTSLYIDHLNGFKDRYEFFPAQVTADAGYGSEENYDYLHRREVEAFVKYSYFHYEQKKSAKKKIAIKFNLHYNAEEDYYICPMGQRMERSGQYQQKTTTGFVQEIQTYQAKNCKGCPLRGICHNSKNNRIIGRNANLEEHKQRAREQLTSEEGIEKRGKRCVEVEGSFGQLKHNKGFRRFYLRGLEKVQIEVGLLAMGMNLAKLAKHLAQPVDEVCPDGSKMTTNQGIKGNIEQKRA